MKKLLLIFGFLSLFSGIQAQHSVNLYASQDLYVETFGGGQGKNAFMKFNISALPTGIAITGAYFNAYVYKWQLGWDGDVRWFHYSNQTWQEGGSNKFIWVPAYFVDTLTQLSGFGTTLNAMNTSVDLKDFLNVDYTAGHTYFSFFGKDVDDPTMWPNMSAVSFNNNDSMLCGNIFNDMMGFRPRTYLNPNQWPYLRVEYGILPIAGTIVGATTVCEGATLTLNAAATGDPALNYQWQKNGANITGATSTTLTISPLMLSDAGNYRFIVTNPYGADTSNAVTVTVEPLPTILISTSAGSVCHGDSAVLTASGANYYQWCCPVYIGNPYVVYPDSSTNYSVTGVTLAGCSSTSNLTISLTPGPVLFTEAFPDTICQGETSLLTTTGASSYQWSHGLGTAQTVSVSPAVTTTYTISGTLNGCTETQEVVVTVIICPGLNEAENAACLIYPNPAENEVYVSIPEKSADAELISVAGERVRLLKIAESSAVIDLRGLSKGFYTLRVNTGTRIYMKKIIVQ